MVKRIITFLFLLIALTALTLLITLIPEILGSEITSEKGKDFLFVVFGENYAWWLLLILVVAIAMLFFFTPDQIKALFKRQEKPIALSPEETKKNYDTIRQYLRQRYLRRKDQKLAGDQLFNLRIKQSNEGASPEKAETFITLQGKKTGAEIRQIFEKARRRLLVTGLPGAGKTSLLLNLALELLETDPENLAVLLNLATWRSDFPSFDDWLREILPAELGVTKRYAADILQQGRLTLLLDGLDEVDEVHRASCMEAIKSYGGQKHRDFLISCRKEEYKAIEKDAPVWAQIEVLPLTDKQLLAQLDAADRRDFPEAPDLKAALEHDPLLLRVAETPFYLNCLQLLFRGGSTLSELKLKGETVEARHAEIIERFTEYELAKQSRHGYKPKQVRHWLAFLASRMTQRNKVVFELVDLQYDWWRWKRKILIFLFNSLVSLFTLGLIFSLPIEFAFQFKDKTFLFHGFWICSIFLFFISIEVLFQSKLEHPIITTIGQSVFDFKTKLIFVITNMVTISAITIFILNQQSYTSSQRILYMSFLILVFLFSGLFAYLVKPMPIINVSTPYQRFIASAKALHFSILQHWLLRWQLYRAGVLPLRLVSFLNEMTARHLLETDGATWRFRHRIIQEHLAGQWWEPFGSLPKKG